MFYECLVVTKKLISSLFVSVDDVNEIEGNRTVEFIRQNGGSAHYVNTDVSNKDSVKECMAKANEWGGNRGIHVLVNNAGILEMGTIETTSLEQ